VSDVVHRRPGRPRAGSEDKRERVLREAFELFAERGYTATSLRDIAEAADISKAGLLHHFGSKEALYSAVLERRDQKDFVGMEDFDGDAWAFLDKWVALVEQNTDQPGMVRLYSAMAVDGVEADHPAHPWLHHHFVRAVQGTAEVFERGKEQGVVHPDAPSRELARTLVAVSDGIQLQWLCARADAEAEGREPGRTPPHPEQPVDMAGQIRLVADLIRARWQVR
jgi:AcrR family transcriptional regulator